MADIDAPDVPLVVTVSDATLTAGDVTIAADGVALVPTVGDSLAMALLSSDGLLLSIGVGDPMVLPDLVGIAVPSVVLAPLIGFPMLTTLVGPRLSPMDVGRPLQLITVGAPQSF